MPHVGKNAFFVTHEALEDQLEEAGQEQLVQSKVIYLEILTVL